MTQSATVLFLAANPMKLQPLQLGEECRAIEEKIRTAKFRDRIRFRSRWAARANDLLQALNEDSPSVLHFSGHGASDQGLCFQSDDGSAVGVSGEGLAQVIRAAGASVAVVVLNACYSEVQARALVACVPCVVGASCAIGDEAAIVYAKAFYSALAFGKSVANAHEQGLAALAVHPTHGYINRDVVSKTSQPATSFRLLPRPGTNPECVYVVHGPGAKASCVVVLKATLRDFDAIMLARAIEELRQLTGDLHLEITHFDEGSVRLFVALSVEAQRKLMAMWRNDELAQICGLDVSAVVDVSMVAKAATTSLAPVPEELSSVMKVIQAPPGTEESPKLAAPEDGHAAAPVERAISVVDESRRTTGSPIPRTARGIKALYVYSLTTFIADRKIEPMTGAPIPPGEVELPPGIYRLPANANIIAVIDKGSSTSSYSIVSLGGTKGGLPDPPLQALQGQDVTADEIMAFFFGAGEEDEI